MNSTFEDVFALSSDFVIAVGQIEDMTSGSNYPTNSYTWDGVNLKPHSLPIDPYDTSKIHLQRYYRVINNIWAFRRDNIWYSSDNAAYAHMTIVNGDTNVFNENYVTRSELADGLGRRLWAKDTSEMYFGATSLYKYKNGVWTYMPPEMYGGKIDDNIGFNSNNILTCSNSSPENKNVFYRFDGVKWNLIWQYNQPSLSDAVNFGEPTSFWSAENDDSVWISGLVLGRIKKDCSGKVRVLKDLQPYGFLRIRGSSKNNVFFIGNDGAITHYNGTTLHDYDLFRGKNLTLRSLSVLQNEVFIVGDRFFGGAVFIHGMRTK